MESLLAVRVSFWSSVVKYTNFVPYHFLSCSETLELTVPDELWLHGEKRRMIKMIVMFWAILYHLYNLKNVKNTHGGVLLLAKLQLY